MKKIIILALEILALIIIAYLFFMPVPREEAEIIEEARAEGPSLTHKQEIWLDVLEWCESRGNNGAINKKDRDGTPSYGAFQFKPSTFEHYREKYLLEMPKVKADEWTFMHYETQREIVKNMILDPDVVWKQEFPDCVKKNGKPPGMLQ
jgi:hypothetical protein